MDGVLYDSMPFHAKAWAMTMRDYNLPFSEYDAYMEEGRTGEATINTIYPKIYGRPATEAEVQKMYQIKSNYFNQIADVKPIPHMLAFLQEMKRRNFDIFIVTGSGQKSLLTRLEQDFPSIFSQEKMVTAFDVKYGKPNPEPYLIALQKGNLKANEAIVVENAPLGIHAAVAANIFTIGVNTGILPDEELLKEGADIIYPNVKAMLNDFSIQSSKTAILSNIKS